MAIESTCNGSQDVLLLASVTAAMTVSSSDCAPTGCGHAHELSVTRADVINAVRRVDTDGTALSAAERERGTRYPSQTCER